MFFSVIIPVYNRPVAIAQAIRSVIEQDLKDWECIVVDDASTDDTARICSDIAKQDSRIRVFSLKENSGVSAARNYGLDRVSVDKNGCILFLDSDDQLMSDAMSTLSAVMETSDADIAVFGINQPGLPFEPPYGQVLDSTWIHANTIPQHLNIVPHSKGFLYPFSCNKCFKSAFISKHGIRFDEWRKTWEDNSFVIQCLDECGRLIIIPDMLYKTGDDPDSEHLSMRIDSELFSSYIKGYEKNVEKFGAQYDYKNDYTPRHFFDVIHRTLVSYYPKCSSSEFQALLQMLLENRTMREWVEGITPKDPSEVKIVSAFHNNDAALLANIYRKLSEQAMKARSADTSWSASIKRAARKVLGNGIIEKIKSKLG